MSQGPPLLTPPPRTGVYGLWSSTDRSMIHGPVQRMLYPTPTLPTQWAPGTNQEYHPMYQAFQPLTWASNPRSSPFMTLTASPSHPIGQYREMAPGWSYPIPTEPSYQALDQDNSPMSLMPQTPTPVPRASSPTGSESSNEGSSTHSDTTIGADPGPGETPSIPIEPTSIDQTSWSETEPYSDSNRPPPGTTGGRISNDDSCTRADKRESPWPTTSLMSLDFRGNGNTNSK